MPGPVAMCPARHQQELCVPGDYRGDGRTPDTHGGGAEVAENQNVIEDQVDGHCRHTGGHGHKGLPAFLQSTGVGGAKPKGQQPPEHDQQIFPAEGEHLGGVRPVPLARKIQPDEGLAIGRKEGAHN